MSRFYTIADHETGNFYKLEKSLFTTSRYRALNANAKVAYSILRDRNDLSIKNNWVDEQGYIYFYFDCTKLAEIMNVSTSTVNSIKKDLRKSGLLFERRQGQGKPNQMYILKPETVDNALNSENRISRIANFIDLEKRKPLGSDTEVNETDRTRLSINASPSEEATTFLEAFEDYFGYEHRKVKEYPVLENYIDEEELTKRCIEYFEKYGTNDMKHNREKCSIENVFSTMVRYELNGEW